MSGQELRARLEALGFPTQVARANALEIAQPVLSRYEAEDRPVSRYVRCRVALLEMQAKQPA